MDAPGAGTYTAATPDKRKAPSYGFGTAEQRTSLIKSQAPGPGTYKIPCSITEMAGYTNARSKDFGYI